MADDQTHFLRRYMPCTSGRAYRRNLPDFVQNTRYRHHRQPVRDNPWEPSNCPLVRM